MRLIQRLIPTQEVLKQLLALATSAFGLVAALAWNEAIQALVNEYLSFGGSGLVSKLIYAVIITIFVVLVTVNLTKIKDRFDSEDHNNTNSQG
jgi:uncharacterized membrane protein